MIDQKIYTDLRQKLDKTQEALRQDLLSIRTGKASPALVEMITASVYNGSATLKIQELATVSLSGPTHLIITPFDVGTLQDIEKAILASPLHFTPRVEGKVIHIDVPSLSEEQRKEYLKLCSAKIEEGRQKVRAGRDESRRRIKQSFESKETSEDEKFAAEKEIDKIAAEFMTTLDELKAKKEREIMEV